MNSETEYLKTVLDLKLALMKDQTIALLKQKGYAPIENAILKSKRDLKNAGYTTGEIKETLLDCFGVDEKLIKFINDNI